MLKKLVAVFAVLAISAGAVFAQVDVNKADQAALDGIRGVGPKLSKAILDERRKGEFKDWADFETRVPGVGEKSVVKLSEAGLTINGKSHQHAGAAANSKPRAAPKAERKDGANKS